jgi:RimJ/RimL family protein N-acetyltransferase
MNPADANNEFICRPLEENEWQTYRAIRLATLEDSRDTERLAQESIYDEAYWRAEVADPANRKLGLFEGKKIAGMTTISLNGGDSAEFTGLYILEKYRNRKLGDLLIQASLNYLQDHHGPEKILTKIWNKNIASQKVAERNGFTYKKTIGDGDVLYRVYSRELRR